MLSQVEAQIYLADQRGRSETEGYRSFHTFNFEPYFVEHRQPFGNLRFFNDDTLGQIQMVQHSLHRDAVIMVLPLVGTLGYHAGLDQGVLDAGQAHFYQLQQEPILEISNLYEQELINYLTIGFSTRRRTDNLRVTFDLDGHPNKLMPLLADTAAIELGVGPIHIGKFEGRSAGSYKVQNPAGVFLFVIEGAFEVQNRLLQSRDGLSLQNVTDVEFEALSNDAILLVIEISEP